MLNRRGAGATGTPLFQMPTRHPPPPKPRPSRAAWWLGGGVLGILALGVAFAAGRLTSGPPEGARRETATPLSAAPAPQEEERFERPLPPLASPAAPRAVSVPGSPPAVAAQPQGYRALVTPVQLAQYRAEVVSHLEHERRRVVSTCRPRETLPRGQASATVTYNMTFNPDGREVGRGIVQDRRASAGKFGKCLGDLRGEKITISPPPGTYVTIRVPVTYP